MPPTTTSSSRRRIEALQPKITRSDIKDKQIKECISSAIHQAALDCRSYTDVATYVRVALVRLTEDRRWCAIAARGVFMNLRGVRGSAATVTVPCLGSELVMPTGPAAAAAAIEIPAALRFSVLVFQCMAVPDESWQSLRNARAEATAAEARASASIHSSESVAANPTGLAARSQPTIGSTSSPSVAIADAACSPSAVPALDDAAAPLSGGAANVATAATAASDVLVATTFAPSSQPAAPQAAAMSALSADCPQAPPLQAQPVQTNVTLELQRCDVATRWVGGLQRSLGLHNDSENAFSSALKAAAAKEFGGLWHVVLASAPPDPKSPHTPGLSLTDAPGARFDITAGAFVPPGVILSKRSAELTPPRYYLSLFQSSAAGGSGCNARAAAAAAAPPSAPARNGAAGAARGSGARAPSGGVDAGARVVAAFLGREEPADANTGLAGALRWSWRNSWTLSRIVAYTLAAACFFSYFLLAFSFDNRCAPGGAGGSGIAHLLGIARAGRDGGAGGAVAAALRARDAASVSVGSNGTVGYYAAAEGRNVSEAAIASSSPALDGEEFAVYAVGGDALQADGLSSAALGGIGAVGGARGGGHQATAASSVAAARNASDGAQRWGDRVSLLDVLLQQLAAVPGIGPVLRSVGIVPQGGSGSGDGGHRSGGSAAATGDTSTPDLESASLPAGCSQPSADAAALRVSRGQLALFVAIGSIGVLSLLRVLQKQVGIARLGAVLKSTSAMMVAAAAPGASAGRQQPLHATQQQQRAAAGTAAAHRPAR